MRLMHMSGKQNAGELRTSIKTRSPEKEGGTLYLPDGNEIPYGDTSDPSVTDAAIAAASEWEKKALLEKKGRGELSGSIKDTSKRYPRVEEYCNVNFSLSKAQSGAIDKGTLQQYKEAIKETVFEFAGTLGVPGAKPILWIDEPHTDTKNYHIQFRVGLHPVNVDTGEIAKDTFDIYRSSESFPSDFAHRLKQKFIDKNLPVTDGPIEFWNEKSGKDARVLNARMFGDKVPSADDYFQEIEVRQTEERQVPEVEPIEKVGEEIGQTALEKAEKPVEKPTEFKVEYTKVEQYQSSIVKQLRAIDAEQELRDAKRAELLLELESSKHTLEAMKENDDLRRKNEIAKKLVQKSTNEKLSMVDALMQAKAEKEHLIENVDKYRTRIIDLNKDKNDLTNEVNTLMSDIATLQTELNEITNEKDEQERLKNESVDREKAIKKELDTANTNNETLKKANEALTNEKLGIEKELSNVKQQNKNLNDLIEEKVTLLVDVETREKTLINKVGHLEKTNNEKLELLAKANENLKIAVDSNKSLQESLDVANKIKNQLEAEAITLKAQIEAVEIRKNAEIDNLKAELEKLKTEAKQRENVQPIVQAEVAVEMKIEAANQNIEYKATPRPLDGYNAVPVGNVTIYENAKGYKTFTDHGHAISLATAKPTLDDVHAMLKVASDKWPDGINVLETNEDFRYKVVKLAAEHGYNVLNEDLKKSIDEYRATLDAKHQEPETGADAEKTEESTQEQALGGSPSLEELLADKDDFLASLRTPDEPEKGDDETKPKPKNRDNDPDR